MRLGKRDDAIQQWRKAIQVDPSNKEIAEKLKQFQSAN
jgi:hypothetical protein